jgi:hypothetical protein
MLSLLNLGGTCRKRDLALLVKHADPDGACTIHFAHNLLSCFLRIARCDLLGTGFEDTGRYGSNNQSDEQDASHSHGDEQTSSKMGMLCCVSRRDTPHVILAYWCEVSKAYCEQRHRRKVHRVKKEPALNA